MKMKEEILLLCYIIIAAINLTNVSWLSEFNWTIIVGMLILLIMVELIKLSVVLKK